MVLHVLRMQAAATAKANIPLLPQPKKLVSWKSTRKEKKKEKKGGGKKRKEKQASVLNMNFWLRELTCKENRWLLVYNQH